MDSLITHYDYKHGYLGLRKLSVHVKRPTKVIHAQDTGHTGSADVVLAKLVKIPAIITVYGLRSDTIELGPIELIIFKKALIRFELTLENLVVKKAGEHTPVLSGISLAFYRSFQRDYMLGNQYCFKNPVL